MMCVLVNSSMQRQGFQRRFERYDLREMSLKLVLNYCMHRQMLVKREIESVTSVSMCLLYQSDHRKESTICCSPTS